MQQSRTGERPSRGTATKSVRAVTTKQAEFRFILLALQTDTGNASEIVYTKLHIYTDSQDAGNQAAHEAARNHLSFSILHESSQSRNRRRCSWQHAKRILLRGNPRTHVSRTTSRALGPHARGGEPHPAVLQLMDNGEISKGAYRHRHHAGCDCILLPETPLNSYASRR